MSANTPQDRLPPSYGVDFSRSMNPRVRAAQSVLVQTREVLPVADLAAVREKPALEGGMQLRDALADLQRRRIDSAIARKNGHFQVDHEAEAFTFATIEDMQALRNRLDFDVQVKQAMPGGGERTVTTSAFALLASSLAVADVTIGAESVPTVMDELVMDIDDVQPSTEIGEPLEVGVTDPTEEPKPLGETEEFREVSKGEDRYTILSYRDGYQIAFTQQLLNQLGGSRVAMQLMELGSGAEQVLEMFGLRRAIDYNGSKSSNAKHHVMIRNRAAAALFSSTANTPSVRTPSGTRVNNNPLSDQQALENIRARLATMRNSAGYPTPTMMKKLLVPDALWLRAWSLLESVNTPGVFGEENFFGPRGPIRPKLLSTPLLDLLTTTHCYAGDPQRQLVRKYRQRPVVAVSQGNTTEAFVRSHEAMRVSIGWDCTIGARAHTKWVESAPSTTSAGG